MSNSDKKKEDKEYEMFQSACNYCLNNNTNDRTRSIMKYLNGNPLKREKNDRPDIINECTKENKNYIVGIEMFCVDQNSKFKRGSLCSKSRESEAIISKIYDKGHKELVETGNVSDEQCSLLLKNTVEYAQDSLNSEYEMLISAFKYNFENHAKKCELYRENLKALSKGKEIELAFFIEIETYFHDLFLNCNNSIIQYQSSLMPMFSEIISIINSNANKSLIDYIVFYLHNRPKSEIQVIAIRTGNIRKNLENQGITIFKYAGEQLLKTGDCNIEKDEKGDYRLEYDLTNPINAEFIKYIMPVYQKALDYQTKRIPFVTSRIVQYLLYVWSYAKTKEDIYIRSTRFLMKFPIEK